MNLRTKFKNFVLIVLMLFVNFQNFIAQDALKDFKTGADQPEKYLPMLKNKTIAVVTNQTGLLHDRTHLVDFLVQNNICLLYTSPSPRDRSLSRMPSSA